jgi:aryl-alcohol dehydrogenase-like predicted oxidoreductase
MRYRRFGRCNWKVSDIGYGMWGMGGWTGSDDATSAAALDRAVELECNFFDTAFAYGHGHSEKLLGELLKRHPSRRLYAATKVPPLNWQWPGKGTTPVDQTFPYEHVMTSARVSLGHLQTDAIDLLQLHVWDDAWTSDGGWQRAVKELKEQGLIRAFGISVNRWEPRNVLRALETGLVDAVQVVFNIFDQSPIDELFPACQRLDVAVIARVPFDEGGLTGTLTSDSRWPEGDFRNMYFAPPHLAATLKRLSPLQHVVAEWNMPLPDAALRFILAHEAVATTIPGMRRVRHVELNMAASDAPPLTPAQLDRLRTFRWDRTPDDRS